MAVLSAKQTHKPASDDNHTIDDALTHLAFDNTSQPNIISRVSNGKIILVNSAACKLLGYSKRELLTKTISALFDPKENSFKKMLKKIKDELKALALVTVIKKGGQKIPCEITASVFLDEDGIEKSITIITDMRPRIEKQRNIDIQKEKIVASNIELADAKQKKVDIVNKKTVADNIIQALIKSNARLTENNRWIKYMAKTSYDVMWDWDIATGDIYVGDSIKEVFGYKVSNNTVHYLDFTNCLLPEEKSVIEKKLKNVLASTAKSWSDSFMLRCHERGFCPVSCRATIIRNEKGKALRFIGAIQDESKLQELEMNLSDKTATINVMAKNLQKQKNSEVKKDKVVEQNILLAIAKQIDIDMANKKEVARNILIALEKQIDIDANNKKIVAQNIAQAISDQKNIDAIKEKKVAENILLVIKKQKGIDLQTKKQVADNIALAKIKQNEKDVKRKAIVSKNIMLAIAKQMELDAKNKKLTARNIVLAITKQTKIDAKNKKLVADNIQRAVSSQKIIDIHKEKIVSDNIIAALLKQKQIDAYSEKVVSENIVVAQSHSDAALRESQDAFLQAAKLSNDVIWDLKLDKNELFIGEGFQELFGHIINNKPTVADWVQHIHPRDADAVEKSLNTAIESTENQWKQIYRYMRADGSVATVLDRASIFRHENGKAYRLIGAMQDMSRHKELEEKLEQEVLQKTKLLTDYDERFKLIFNSTSEVLYDSDLITGNVIISDAYENIYGYKIQNNMTPVEDWISHIHPEDRETVNNDFFASINGEAHQWIYKYRFLAADGTEFHVKSNAVILRDKEGKAFRVIGSMQDINKQALLEDQLAHEIKLKEKQITQAAEDARDTERSDIGKELHDNVNQLLGASRMYIDMAKRGGADSEMYLNRSSEYTLTAIEEIRKLTHGLTTDTIKNLGLCDAIEILSHDMMEVRPIKIGYDMANFEERGLDYKFKLNLFRIVQEHLNNILKHAKASMVHITLTQNKKLIKMSITDDGVGFDTKKKQNGIGLANIKNRAASFNGTAEFHSQPGEGCILKIVFTGAGIN